MMKIIVASIILALAACAPPAEIKIPEVSWDRTLKADGTECRKLDCLNPDDDETWSPDRVTQVCSWDRAVRGGTGTEPYSITVTYGVDGCATYWIEGK